MFGIGMPEMLLILAIALIVIGPKKLPDLAKYLGRAIGEFKKAASDFKDSIDIDNNIGELKNKFDDINDNIQTATDVKSFVKSELLDTKSSESKGSAAPNQGQDQSSDQGSDQGSDQNAGEPDHKGKAEGVKSDKGFTNGQ